MTEAVMSSAAAPISRAAKKNAKRRAAKRKLGDGEDSTDTLKTDPISAVANGQLVNGHQNGLDCNKPGSTESGANADTMRTRLKHLQRKVKDINKIEETKSKGVKLDATQMMKLKSKNGMLDEIYDLEIQINKTMPSVQKTASCASVTGVSAANTAAATVNGTTVTGATAMVNGMPSQPIPAAAAGTIIPGNAMSMVTSPQVALNAAAGFPLPPQAMGNPLLPLPGNMPYFLPSMMMPPPPGPNMMGYFPPVRPFPPMGAPMPMPDSTALPTQAMATGDARPLASPASPTVAGATNGVPQPQQMMPPVQPLMMQQPLYPQAPIPLHHHHHQQPQQQQQQARRPATKVVIRDPSTGDDITEKILGKRTTPAAEGTSATASNGLPHMSSLDSSSFPPLSASNGGPHSNATTPGTQSSSANLAEQVALLGISGSTSSSAPSSPQSTNGGIHAWSTAAEHSTSYAMSTSPATLPSMKQAVGGDVVAGKASAVAPVHLQMASQVVA